MLCHRYQTIYPSTVLLATVEQIEEEIEEEFNEEGTPEAEAEAADSARQSEVSEGSEPTAVESDSEGVTMIQHRSRQKKGKTKSVSVEIWKLLRR